MAVDRQIGRGTGQRGLDDFQRPQRDIVRGLEFARRLLALGDLRPQERAARQRVATGETRFGQLGLQLTMAAAGVGAA